jgi:hypothetical protein
MAASALAFSAASIAFTSEIGIFGMNNLSHQHSFAAANGHVVTRRDTLNGQTRRANQLLSSSRLLLA